MERSYSENYFGGDRADPARNVAVECFRFDSSRFVFTYAIFIAVFYGLIHGSGYSTAESRGPGARLVVFFFVAARVAATRVPFAGCRRRTARTRSSPSIFSTGRGARRPPLAATAKAKDRRRRRRSHRLVS